MMKATLEELMDMCKPYVDQGRVNDTFDDDEIITMACTALMLETLKEIRATLQQMIGGKNNGNQ